MSQAMDQLVKAAEGLEKVFENDRRLVLIDALKLIRSMVKGFIPTEEHPTLKMYLLNCTTQAIEGLKKALK